MTGVVMAGMSAFRPAAGLIGPLAHRFLLFILLFFPLVSIHAQQDDLHSQAAIESGRSDSPADASYRAMYGEMDDAIDGRIQRAELVARVKITGVHRMIDNALSQPGMVAVLGYVYSGVAEKVWKGEPSNLVAFRLTLDDCDRKLERGVQYVIFAESDTQGRLQLSSCEAAVEDSDAAKLLAQLDLYYQG